RHAGGSGGQCRCAAGMVGGVTEAAPQPRSALQFAARSQRAGCEMYGDDPARPATGCATAAILVLAGPCSPLPSWPSPGLDPTGFTHLVPRSPVDCATRSGVHDANRARVRIVRKQVSKILT